MILWLWLCWGFSTSAGQPDSELMARYLEEELMADYSIMEQVSFKAVVVREHLVAGAGLSRLNHQYGHAGQPAKTFIAAIPAACPWLRQQLGSTGGCYQRARQLLEVLSQERPPVLGAAAWGLGSKPIS